MADAEPAIPDEIRIIITGDHGFSTIRQVMRPNVLIKDLPVRFIAAGGSAFLYNISSDSKLTTAERITSVTDRLNQLPKGKRKLFKIINREELDEMGADSAALMAIAAIPGTVFSSSTNSQNTTNRGPGTKIQQSKYEGLFFPTNGGHHGYDPKDPDMWTGFIAQGAGINKGGHIKEMKVVNLSPLIAKLLNIVFTTPDGQLPDGIVKTIN